MNRPHVVLLGAGVLSLRPKDVIATFKQLLFLHGNVLAAYCERDGIHGQRGAKCSKCGQPLAPGKLLYPVGQKNNESDPAIRSDWETVKYAFKNAFMVTFFGYSAPKSDVGALELLQEAWGDWRQRHLEQVEMIDIKPEDELFETWRPFVHTHTTTKCITTSTNPGFPIIRGERARPTGVSTLM